MRLRMTCAGVRFQVSETDSPQAAPLGGARNRGTPPFPNLSAGFRSRLELVGHGVVVDELVRLQAAHRHGADGGRLEGRRGPGIGAALAGLQRFTKRANGSVYRLYSA